MNRRAFLAGLSVPALVPPRARGASRIPLSGERRVSFNDSWRFLKAEAKAAKQPDFNDAGWNEIRLPHDWAIAGPFDSNLNPHTGALPIFGTGWYRKRFGLPESARNRYFTIEFDGAMSNARVWLNGQRLGERPYGYSSFALELTPHLRYGAEKVLGVRLSPEDRSSRWYPGAGIYRNVWLTITGPVHVGHWGTDVTTPEVTDEKATVAVKTELRNRSDREVKVALRSSIRDATAKVVTAARSELTIGPGAGFPKDRYYLYQSVWSEKPMVHVLPHWNWEGREGRTIPVMCYSNADEVELSLNGRSLGRKQRFAEPVELPVGPNVSRDRKFVSKYRLLWQVPYERGTLRAVGFRNGELVAADEVRTAGTPAKIAMLPDRRSIHAEGDDLSFVTVRIEDGQGTLCPGADNLTRFEVAGPGFVQAVDNGNAVTIEPFQARQRRAFNGLALLIVRSKAGPGGKIQVTAAADGLEPGKTEITAGR